MDQNNLKIKKGVIIMTDSSVSNTVTVKQANILLSCLVLSELIIFGVGVYAIDNIIGRYLVMGVIQTLIVMTLFCVLDLVAIFALFNCQLESVARKGVRYLWLSYFMTSGVKAVLVCWMCNFTPLKIYLDPIFITAGMSVVRLWLLTQLMKANVRFSK